MLLNSKPAETETQLKAGHQIELDVPATGSRRREKAIEQGGLEPDNCSLFRPIRRYGTRRSSPCAPWPERWGSTGCCWRRVPPIFTAARAGKLIVRWTNRQQAHQL